MLTLIALVVQLDSTRKPAHLDTVVTRGRVDNLVGIAASSNQGSVGAADLSLRPLLRPGEIVENVPGVIVTQHSGSGKANQYFLRGFNLDHGTDLALSLDGVPVNMPTHAHGQGYADLNFVIPELIERVDFKKGPYYADVGDFGSAGAFNIEYYSHLPDGVARLEGGQASYERAVIANNAGDLIYAGAFEHNDGPWAIGDDERKFDGVLRSTAGDAKNGFTLTGMGYHNDWHSTDQVPERAITDGLINRWSEIDSTDAGNTGRYSLTGEWHATGPHSKSRVVFYGLHYNLDLFSDFTYFLNDPVHGDQIEQRDSRTVTGARAMHTEFGTVFGVPTRNVIGLDVRYDNIDNGLYRTERRVRLATVTVDGTNEVGGAPYVENTMYWLPWLRTVVGLRGDLLWFHVRDAASGGGLFDPKANITFGPWAKTELYVDAGDGFHSNDARGMATPMPRSTGAEVGARTAIIPGLQSSVSLWLLDLQSELVWDGDAGTNVPSGPTRRYGIELGNYYTPVRWLTIDADYAWSQARFRDHESAGAFVPEALVSTFDGGIAFRDLLGLRFRYFGPRPLTQDGTVYSKATSLLYAAIGYQITPRLRVSLTVFNILNTTASDIDYYYVSRLRGEPLSGIAGIETHPAEPRELRASASISIGPRN